MHASTPSPSASVYLLSHLLHIGRSTSHNPPPRARSHMHDSSTRRPVQTTKIYANQWHHSGRLEVMSCVTKQTKNSSACVSSSRSSHSMCSVGCSMRRSGAVSARRCRSVRVPAGRGNVLVRVKRELKRCTNGMCVRTNEPIEVRVREMYCIW